MRKRLVLALGLLAGCGRTITAPPMCPAYVTDSVTFAGGVSVTIVFYEPCRG